MSWLTPSKVATVAAAGILTLAGLLAQTPPAPQSVVRSIPAVSAEPAGARSPVDYFRELLAMSLTERKQSLSNRPPEVQRRVLAKLREYESLKSTDRELRLRATELRWYLLPLMSEPRSNRAARLAEIPLADRQLVQDRLTLWDLLPPPLQEEFLNDEMSARYFSQFESSTRDQWTNIVAHLSPERRLKLQAGIEQWRRLTPDQRQKTVQRFEQFFELTPEEKEKALDTFSESEQQQMEKTLQAYGKLTPEQRTQCIQSFQKFASMTLAERQQFLKNAERWKLMSADERTRWRTLVSVAPILPPMPDQVFPPMPPPNPPIDRPN